MEKVQISQDVLYEYILSHGIKMSRLAELIGRAPEVVMSCFKHHNNMNGNPRYFNDKHIALINEALPILADELRGSLLKWGSNQTYTNRLGVSYDPALVEQIKSVGRYMNITALVERVLGWSKGKKSAVLVQSSSTVYGHVSQADAERINTEILAVVGMLSNVKIVLEDGDNDRKK